MKNKKNFIWGLVGSLLAIVAGIIAFLISKPRQELPIKGPSKINIPSNVRDIARSRNLNELVNEFRE